MKIFLVTYYGIKDALKSASESLERYGHSVSSFPLFQYAYDEKDRRENYAQMFIDEVEKEDPDVILWWFFQIPTKVLYTMYESTNTKLHALFCWDDPFVWKDQAIEMDKKAGMFDLVFVSCQETLDEYVRCGSKKAFYLLPGYDSRIFRPICGLEYDCDVSICCTNLYVGSVYNEQLIPRKELLDKISADKTIKFKVYGPAFLKSYYPDNYSGLVGYSDLPIVFNRSRINICTHVIGTKYKYVNERLVLILACGGLLYVDNVKGLGDVIDNTDECVLINKEDPVGQIHKILDDYGSYEPVKIKGRKASEKFTWDKWALKISEELTNTNKVLVPKRLDKPKECSIDNWILLLDAIRSIEKGDIDKISFLETLQIKLPYLDVSQIIKSYIVND